MTPLRLWTIAVLTACIPRVGTAQVRVSDIEVGAHFGFDFSNGDIDDERVGLQGVVPVFGSLEVAPAVAFYINFLDDPGSRFEGSAWQGYLTVRVRPWGRGTFLALGYGLTLHHVTVRDRQLGDELSDSEVTDVGVIGLTLPVWRVRPFVDLYLVDLLDRESAVGGNLLFGLSVRLP